MEENQDTNKCKDCPELIPKPYVRCDNCQEKFLSEVVKTKSEGDLK